MIAKQYNYLFYLTVRVVNWCSNNLIVRPLVSILKLLPISEERILKVKKLHLRPIDSYDNGINVNYAYSLMTWTLTCFILTIELLIFKILKHLELEDSIIFIFTVAVFLSIMFNYLILWKSDRYEAYFRKFTKEQTENKGYIVAIAYHLTITILCFSIAINA